MKLGYLSKMVLFVKQMVLKMKLVVLIRENIHLWVDSSYPSAVLLGSEYYTDMRHLDKALSDAGVDHELVDPLMERNMVMQHCFVGLERVDDVARDAFDRMIRFIKSKVENN